jgi:hypothetical protein
MILKSGNSAVSETCNLVNIVSASIAATTGPEPEQQITKKDMTCVSMRH